MRITPPPFMVLLAGGVTIGFSPILVRLSELGPVATAFYRLSLALPMLYLLVRLVPVGTSDDSDGRDGGLYLLAGVAFAFDIICWHWSITLTTVANATLFANFAPVFVVLGSWILWRQKPGAPFLLALMLGLAGVVVLVGSNLRIDPDRIRGDLLGIVTAFFYAIYILAVARLRRHHPVLKIMFRSTLISAIIVFPVAALTEQQLWVDSIGGLVTLLVLALFAHAGGQGMITWALAHLSASFSSLTLLIQPVVAALLAWMLFSESLTPVQLSGAALVLGAIVLAGMFQPRRQNDD